MKAYIETYDDFEILHCRKTKKHIATIFDSNDFGIYRTPIPHWCPIKNRKIKNEQMPIYDFLRTLDDMLEFLADHELLSEKGMRFKHEFWKKFVKGR